jgi:UDP-2,3-diacylglucosamine pyrophosphatase LpxH
MQPVVVLSDLHFGQSEHSLIKGTETFKLFFEDMNRLKEKHGDLRFVLAGDIFDLWRDYSKNAIPYAKDLFKGIKDLAASESDIVYIPGNHDHFVKMKVFGKPLYGKTNMTKVDPGKSDTLRALKGLGVGFDIEYPDYHIMINKDKKITISHGHFLTEEIGVDDWFIRFYLFWARFWHMVTPSRKGLEKRKINTYERLFKHLVKTFASEKKKKLFKGKPKSQIQDKYDKWDKKKLRNNWEIMNMKRKRWNQTCHIYIGGHTHLAGRHKLTTKYKIPYLNSGAIHGESATYLLLFEKKVEIWNVGGKKVCKDHSI